MNYLRNFGAFLAFIWLALGASANAGESFAFQEVTAARGLAGYVMAMPGQGGGVIAADYDNDGDVDLFAPTDDGVPDLLFQNQGDGTFIEIGAALGVASMANSRAALWFDYDGDRDLDLLVARDGYLDAGQIPVDTLQLYRYDAEPGVYTNVTAASLIGGNRLNGEPTHIGGLCAGDINNDGLVDFMVTQWRGEHYLFLNNGLGLFINIGVSSGVSSGLDSPRETSWQPIMFDVNRDGWLDIFVCVDFQSNRLFLNNRNLTFTDIAPAAGVDSAWNEMGVAIADYNGDGLVDMYITNIHRFDGAEQRRNRLYHNISTAENVLFTDMAAALGVDDGHFGWGATFLDANRDALVDIAEINGNASAPEWSSQPSCFFRHNGVSYDNVSLAVNFAQVNTGSALIAFDADRDGDLDLVQTCATGCTLMLLDNVQDQSNENNYLVVKPRMDGRNHFAIGAEVRIVTAGRTQTRVITAGNSFLGQEPAEAHFGLSMFTVVDQIIVRWPSGGGETVVNNTAANQALTIIHYACPGDVDGLGTVDVFDLFKVLEAWETDGLAQPGVDIDSSGLVDVFDLFILLEHWGDCPVTRPP